MLTWAFSFDRFVRTTVRKFKTCWHPNITQMMSKRTARADNWEMCSSQRLHPLGMHSLFRSFRSTRELYSSKINHLCTYLLPCIWMGCLILISAYAQYSTIITTLTVMDEFKRNVRFAAHNIPLRYFSFILPDPYLLWQLEWNDNWILVYFGRFGRFNGICWMVKQQNRNPFIRQIGKFHNSARMQPRLVKWRP